MQRKGGGGHGYGPVRAHAPGSLRQEELREHRLRERRADARRCQVLG